MLIVEGPDGSGKTHLAKRLAEKFNLKYRRYPGLSSSSGPDGAGIVEWWNEQIGQNDPDAIYDRCFYISETIYQPATPGRPLIVDGEAMASGIIRLANMDPSFIFCLPPLETTLSNVHQSERDRLQGVDDFALTKIHWAYWSFYGMWSNQNYPAVTMWDYTRHVEELIDEWVKGELRRHRGD